MLLAAILISILISSPFCIYLQARSWVPSKPSEVTNTILDALSSLASAPDCSLSLIIRHGLPKEESLFSFLYLLLIYPANPLGFVAGACAHDTRIEFARTADGSISFAKCHAKRRLIVRGIDRVHCRGFFDFDARYGGGDRQW